MMESSKPCPKVHLRALEPEDLDCLYEIENDERLWNVGITNVPYSKNLLLDYIMQASGDIYSDKQVRMMAENEAGEIVGIVDLMDFSPQHNRAELGIVIKNEFRGKGYAVAVLQKIVEYARNVIHLHQIFAIVPKNNQSCIKFLQSSDFQQTMCLKDWLFDGKEYNDAIFFQKYL